MVSVLLQLCHTACGHRLTATGDTTARAQVVAKYLAAIGRSDIPVGVGVPNSNRTLTPLYGWATDFSLSKYPGTVYEDGVGAAVDIIRASPVKVTIIAIAPATNFPMLLARGGAAVVANARVAAMSGSIHYGYNNSTTPTNECTLHPSPPSPGKVVLTSHSWCVGRCGCVVVGSACYRQRSHLPRVHGDALQCRLGGRVHTSRHVWNSYTCGGAVQQLGAAPNPSRVRSRPVLLVVDRELRLLVHARYWQLHGRVV